VSFPLSSYTREELAAYGEANPALFRIAKLSKITKSSVKEAEQILGTIRGEVSTFEDAARTYSQDTYTDQGGAMGTRWAYELASEIPNEAEREKVMALKKGELSAVIEVPGGWAFFRAEEDPLPLDSADEAALDKIRAYLMDFERGRIEDRLIGDAGELAALIREEGFEEALALRGIEKKDFGPLPINYGNVRLLAGLSSFTSAVPELYNAETNETFWTTAFSTPLESPSRPLVLGSYVVLLYPREETEEAGEGSPAAEAERSYTGGLLGEFTNESIRYHFITSDKMDDRFSETYNRLFLPAY
jgi:hypothetical protein